MSKKAKYSLPSNLTRNIPAALVPAHGRVPHLEEPLATVFVGNETCDRAGAVCEDVVERAGIRGLDMVSNRQR